MKRIEQFRRLQFSLLAISVASFVSLCYAQLEPCGEVGKLPHNTDGSFYYSSELRYGQDLSDLGIWTKRLGEALKADGTLLVIVPIPSRGMANGAVVTDEALKALGTEFSVDEARAYYEDYVASLGPVVAINLLDVAQSLNSKKIGYQQKLDRHWTPEGAEASAQAIAKVLLKDSTYQTFVKAESTEFTTTLTGKEPGGNEFFELIEEKCGEQSDELREMINLYETRQVDEGDLFTEKAPVVAIAGDSFSTEPYNFDGFLSEALSQPVLNASIYGGGLDSSLQDLLLEREPGGNPKVIVWEYRMKDAAGATKEGDYTAFRQMIPSVYGACTAETALFSESAEVSGEKVDLLTSADPDISGENYYLHLQASDLSLVEFEVISSYTDGSVDTALINRSTRGHNSGEYYLELSRDISAPLASVSLNVPADTTGTVEAQLCLVPSRYRHQDSLSSNKLSDVKHSTRY